jgi:phosphate transport system substrate-binding protein
VTTKKQLAQKLICAFSTVGLMVAMALPIGCAKDPKKEAADSARSSSVNEELRGKIDIDGSSTVFPITEAAASQFRKRFPNVNINVGVSGTGGGFKRFTRGETDISDASRPIDRNEFAGAIQSGVKMIELPIAYDGLTIVVHPANDWVDQLTVEEIKKIYSAGIDGASAPKRWSEIRTGFPDSPIEPFAPGTDSGTFDYFREVIIGKGNSLRGDMSTSEDDNVLVTGVAGSAGSIGFFGAAYYEENKTRVRAVPVVNPETGVAVMPSSETIQSGEYAPLSRPVFIYVKADSISRPEIKLFVDYYLQNAAELVKSVGYQPLPAEIYQMGQANFRGRKSGTHYLTAEGEKRAGGLVEVFSDENRQEAL